MRNMLLFKRCGSCAEYKAVGEFSTRRADGHSLKSYCRPCERSFNRSYYRDKDHPKQRNRVRANSARYRARNHQFVWTYLEQHPCVDCGESDPIVLEFDHVSDKVCNVSDLASSQAARHRIETEIAKCVVRCANCHRRKTAVQLGWKVCERADAKKRRYGR